MEIWIDADACPAAIKEILYKAAIRTSTKTTLVSNSPLRIPKSEFLSFILVKAGADVADSEIVEQMQEGDLVITADIPLADRVIEKGGTALDPRGELYTADNIKSRLSTRDFMDSLRSAGIETGGPPTLNAGNKQEFANNLDRILTKHKASNA